LFAEFKNAQELSLHLQRQGFDVLEGSVTDQQLEVIVSVAGLQDLWPPAIPTCRKSSRN